jgi:Tfp pilus assembly protein PilF
VLPLLTQLALQESQQAVRADDPAGALEHALDARQLQPWAAAPYLQLALVHEVRGDLPAASVAIEEAIERDPENWRMWLVAARIETSSGRIAEARSRLARAVELNPRSPLFASEN